MVNAIAFPGLRLGPFMVRESFQLFGLTIHWYGVIIAAGILVAYLYCTHIAKDFQRQSFRYFNFWLAVIRHLCAALLRNF